MTDSIKRLILPLDILGEDGEESITTSPVLFHTVPPKDANARVRRHLIHITVSNTTNNNKIVTVALDRQSGKRLPSFSKTFTIELAGEGSNSSRDQSAINILLGEDVELRLSANAVGVAAVGWVEIV